MALTMLQRDFRMEATVDPGATGSSTILGRVRLPRMATLAYQEFHAVLHGTTDKAPDKFMEYLITQHYLPQYEGDADTIATATRVIEQFNKRVPKVLPVHTETDSDQAFPQGKLEDFGQAEGAIYWRPDALHEMMVDKGQPLKPYQKHGILGWLEGKAYRNGPNNVVRYMESFGGGIAKGITAGSNPGILIWVLTIPPANELDAQINQTRPQGNEYGHLDFLAPPRSPIGVKDDSLVMSTMSDYWHWAIQRIVEGDSRNDPDELYIRIHAKEWYSRQPIVAAQGAPNSP